MALLPAIASFFNVTVDALLGIDDATARQKVEQYLSRFQEALAKGDVDACIAIARQGISEFPNDYALLNKLMYALFLSGDAVSPAGKKRCKRTTLKSPHSANAS